MISTVLFAAIHSVAMIAPAQHNKQVVLPDTTAGKEMASFLRSYNSGKSEDERWKRYFAVYGPLELWSIRKESAQQLGVWARGTKTGGWLGLNVILKEQPPNEVDGIGTVTGFFPSDIVLPKKPLSERQIASRLNPYLDSLAKEDFFSGSVLVAKGNHVLFNKSYGLASKSYNVRNRPDTSFNLASGTKLFTALAVASLVESGKLKFEDTVGHWLPGYPIENASTITIHQLLTHTSGLGRSQFHNEGLFDRLPRSMAELLSMTIAKSAFLPGTDNAYSNEGYLVLGAIVEKASGMPFFDFVKSRILQPAGMNNSGWFSGDEEIANVATGYTHWRWKGNRDFEFEDGPRRNTSFMRAIRGNPASAAYASAEDLFRLSQAIRSGKIVSSQMWSKMTSPYVPLAQYPGAALEEAYGYGLEIWKVKGNTILTRAGLTDGASSRFDMYPESGYSVIVLSNYDAGICNIVADYIVGMLCTDKADAGVEGQKVSTPLG